MRSCHTVRMVRATMKIHITGDDLIGALVAQVTKRRCVGGFVMPTVAASIYSGSIRGEACRRA